MKLVALLRVSTIGQVKDGLGLPTQERMVKAWARSSGHKLVAIISENGKSGVLPVDERPQLLEALAMIKRGEGEGLLVTSLDRLARALTNQEAILGAVWGMGGKVFTVDGGEVLADDVDDPMRTAMRQMAGVFAQLDRALVIKRLRNGRLTKKAAGGHSVGRAPYGWRASEGELVEDSAEQAIVAQMVAWSGEGVVLADIAQRLNEAGTASKAGKKWFPMTISRVLQRAATSK